MMSPASASQDRPDPVEVRSQVQHMVASEVFAKSPQLSAFLLFVVEAAVRGKTERLKGYTIGVEVLRRDVSFDPQIDPIVRVEATRLRRAIGRYYAGPGTNDPVQIDLPPGGYVPRISWREGAASLSLEGERVIPAPGNGFPTLRIAPFAVIGTADTRLIAAETLASRIAEAFALFDIVNITMAAPDHARARPLSAAAPLPGAGPDYRLDGSVEYRGNQCLDLRFKLVDESDSTVTWSRAFEGI